MGYSPWGHKESDMTECSRIHTHKIHDCTQQSSRHIDYLTIDFRSYPGMERPCSVAIVSN